MIRLRWPIVATLAIVAMTGRTTSLINADGGALPAGVRFDVPAAYILTSPASRALDAISLFSVPQTLWFFGVFLALWIAVRTVRTSHTGRTSRRTLLRIVLMPVAFCVLTEGVVILLPRPMARITVADRNVVSVDFHSHTNASHDAYRRYTVEKSRRWHAAGGFDIVYVTDHVKWGGAVAARPLNPIRAGDGTSMLTGVEGHYHKVSTIMLGFDASDSAKLTHWGELKQNFPNRLTEPVTIAALPANLDSVERAIEDTLPHFLGIELVDAAPRGLGQLDRQENAIRRIASSHRLALVASSNNHGWGQTAAAWNLVIIPGWRVMPPDSVGALLENVLRGRDPAAVTIIERYRPRLTGTAAVFTFPVTVFEVIGSLTDTERVVWLLWVWGAFALVFLTSRKSELTGKNR